MMLGRKIAVQASVKAAFEFARVNAPKTAGALSIILLFEIAASLAPGYGLSKPAILVLKGFEAVFSIIAQGALYRLAFAQEHSGDPEFRMGRLGLQWGRPETRLLGAHLLLFFLVFLAMLFWVMIVIVTLGAGMFVSGPGAASLGSATAPLEPTQQQMGQLLLASVPVLLLVLGVYVRICLYGAATVAERKIAVFSTWSLTRGNFWPILGAVVLLAIPIPALSLLSALPGEPQAATIVVEVLSCALDAFLILPMYCGLYAHIYTALRPTAAADASVGVRGPWG
jgi:hypothetical protein